MSLRSNVKSKRCSSPLQNPRQKDDDEIQLQLLVLQHLINVDIFTERSVCSMGVNVIYTGLTGPQTLFSLHENRGIFAPASYFGLDDSFPSLRC